MYTTKTSRERGLPISVQSPEALVGVSHGKSPNRSAPPPPCEAPMPPQP